VTSVDGSWIGDDDRLLAELGEAVRAGRAVPEQFVQIGKAAFAWHDIDAELARLTFDSAPGAGMAAAGAAAAGLRSDRAALRSLTFVSSELTIELEVHPDAIRGQVVPPQPGTVCAGLVTPRRPSRSTRSAGS
jgi:hypothetical protein